MAYPENTTYFTLPDPHPGESVESLKLRILDYLRTTGSSGTRPQKDQRPATASAGASR